MEWPRPIRQPGMDPSQQPELVHRRVWRRIWYCASPGVGFGIVFGNEWCCGTWAPDEVNFSIEWKELYPVVLALAMWGGQLSGRRLVVRCDNETVCNVWKSGTCKAKPVMALLRAGLLIAAWHNVVVLLVPIPGADNVLADCLSRLQVRRFKQLHPAATPIPRVPRQGVLRALTKQHGTSYAEAWRQVRVKLTRRPRDATNSLQP